MPAVQLSTAFIGVVWFVLWTGFSFCAHYYARDTIKSNSPPTETAPSGGLIDRWLVVTLLTIVQVVIGAIVIRIFLVLLDKNMLPSFLYKSADAGPKQNGQLKDRSDVEPCSVALYIAHATATLSTNASIAFVNTGSAFTIKAFEPVTSAFLTSMLLGTRLSAHVVVALPLVVSGALGFVTTPDLRNTATLGLGMAFVSNILFGVRNINMKLYHNNMSSLEEKLKLLQTASIYSAMCLTVLAAVLSVFATEFSISQWVFLPAISSGFFHITYTLISTCVILRYTSIVGHATANLLKRILVAAVFFLQGKTILTSENWLMGTVMVVGLLIYVFPHILPFNDGNSSLSLIAVVSLIVVLVAGFSPSTQLGAATTQCAPAVLPPLDIASNLEARHNELSVNKELSDIEKYKAINVYEEPGKANLVSIEMTNHIDLIKEAYRLHELTFTHILGKYKRAVLVNVFQWFNKGDHLITIGQRRILERMGIELIYHCYYPGYECDFSKIDKTDKELVVLIQGAGYIGHPSHEHVVTLTMEGFPNNRIMVFPISVCHPTPPCDHIIEFSKIFAKHNDVHIVLRDKYSFELAEKYFKTTHNYMAPDSAFAVGSIRMNIVPIYDIVWLKRDDWESQGDAMPDFTKYPNLKVQVTDWSDDWMNQPSDNFWEDHQLRTMTGIAFLARAKVVVSDRLHAHIMCQLMGKLNVAINSQTKKQEHYYRTWEQSVRISRLVNNNLDAMAEAVKLLDMYAETVTIV